MWQLCLHSRRSFQKLVPMLQSQPRPRCLSSSLSLPFSSSSSSSSSLSSFSSTFLRQVSHRSGTRVSSQSPSFLKNSNSWRRISWSVFSLCSRGFRVSRVQKAPPLIAALAGVKKLGLVGVSRVIGWTYRHLPDSWRNFIQKHQIHHKGLVFSSLLVGLYIASNLRFTPITHRLRFLAVTPRQLNDAVLADYNLLIETYKDVIVPKDHPVHVRLTKMVDRLVAAGINLHGFDLFDKDWEVTIIQDPTVNACALPNGKIFVFAGLLNLMDEDMVAFCIGHEIAHAVLSHAAEKGSVAQILAMVESVAAFVIASLVGFSLTDYFLQGVRETMVDLLAVKPYSRKMEFEADQVGQELSVRACYSPEGCTGFFEMTSYYTSLQQQKQQQQIQQQEQQQQQQEKTQVQSGNDIVGGHQKQSPKLVAPDEHYIELDPEQRLDLIAKARETWLAVHDEKGDKPKLNADSSQNTILNVHQHRNRNFAELGTLLSVPFQSELTVSSAQAKTKSNCDSDSDDDSGTSGSYSYSSSPSNTTHFVDGSYQAYFSTHPQDHERTERILDALPLTIRLRDQDGICHRPISEEIRNKYTKRNQNVQVKD